VLVIRTIHVTYHLRLPEEYRATAAKVHDFHADFCPVARTLAAGVEITTELDFQALF
jgi:organic hydroperoxide reductase OsmC/OhrA